jgi:hypothetical protein
MYMQCHPEDHISEGSYADIMQVILILVYVICIDFAVWSSYRKNSLGLSYQTALMSKWCSGPSTFSSRATCGFAYALLILIQSVELLGNMNAFLIKA